MSGWWPSADGHGGFGYVLGLPSRNAKTPVLCLLQRATLQSMSGVEGSLSSAQSLPGSAFMASSWQGTQLPERHQVLLRIYANGVAQKMYSWVFAS